MNSENYENNTTVLRNADSTGESLKLFKKPFPWVKIRFIFVFYSTEMILKILKVVHSQKLGLRKKQIILLSRIEILLLKGSFEREEIILQEKNLKIRIIK